MHSPKVFRYGSEFFGQSSLYFDALDAAEKIAREHHSSLPNGEWVKLRTLLVHECEQSKVWAQLWDMKDDPQRAIDEWHNLSRSALLPLVSRLSELNRIDERHGYDLRDTFHRSAQFAMSPNEPSEAWLPNVNVENSGFSVPTGGPVAQQVELQLLSRLFLGRFPDWLGSLEAEIRKLHSGFELGRRIGPMWINPPLSRRQVLSRSSERLATLALIARLQAIFRRLTDSQHPTIPTNLDSVCGDIPESGLPCWSTISMFVLATFSSAPDMRVLEQRWSAFRSNRSISLQDWPERVHRQESATIK